MKSKERVPTLFRPACCTEGGNIPFVVVSVHLNIQSERTTAKPLRDYSKPAFRQVFPPLDPRQAVAAARLRSSLRFPHKPQTHIMKERTAH